jgi:hypothetical protein
MAWMIDGLAGSSGFLVLDHRQRRMQYIVLIIVPVVGHSYLASDFCCYLVDGDAKYICGYITICNLMEFVRTGETSDSY